MIHLQAKRNVTNSPGEWSAGAPSPCGIWILLFSCSVPGTGGFNSRCAESPVSVPTEVIARPKSKSAIPRQSLAAAVVERLREKILSGELAEGEQLRQESIAAEFETSRIPVREALSHLAGEGLVKIVGKNRGAVVAALSPDEIMQLFETRAVLESYIVRLAIPKMTEEDFRKAEEILARYERSLEHESEEKSWGRWNWNFHSALYAPANRLVMMSFLRTLNLQCDRYTRLHLAVTRDQHQAGKAHRALLEICRTKDPEEARDWEELTRSPCCIQYPLRRANSSCRRPSGVGNRSFWPAILLRGGLCPFPSCTLQVCDFVRCS